MICSLGLREVAAFYFYGNGEIHNEAIVKESLGQPQAGSSLLGAYVRQWLPSKDRQRSWVYWDKKRVEGLVSTRTRCGPRVREINRLLLFRRNKEACLALLDRLKTMGGELAVSKIFLRLAQDSPYAEVPQAAGFSCYLTERLYLLKVGREQRTESVPSTFSPRLRKKGDERLLFQLYNACVPPTVRQSEGITFDEWQQCRENAGGSMLEQLWMEEDNCVGWLRSGIHEGIGLLELMAHPGEEAVLDSLLDSGLRYLRDCSAVLCLSAEYQNKLHALLDAHGFQPVVEYRLMLRPLTVPVSQPCAVPVRA